MASMFAAAVSAALAVYVVVQAARGMRAAVPAYSFDEAVMVRNERRDGRLVCAFALAFSLFLAAFACYVALVPGAAEAMQAATGLRLAALTAGGALVSAFCIRETARLGSTDTESDLYQMREVPLVYAALVWAALVLNYAIALA